MSKIRLPYVKQYVDRHGKVRRYLRRPGSPQIALPGNPGSIEFMNSYNTGIATEAKAKPAHSKSAEGSVGALVERYYRSTKFSNLVASSQTTYRRILDKFAIQHGHRLVADMPRQAAVKIIEDVGLQTPAMANLTGAVMKGLFSYAIDIGLRPDNPFFRIERYLVGSHHTWTEDEIRAYEVRWPIGTRQRLAFDLLIYTGQRVGDVARMRHADMTSKGKSRFISLRQQKTSVDLVIEIHANLLRSLGAFPRRGEHLLPSFHGREMTAQGLSDLVARSARAAGLPDQCKPHGLRKALMRRLAEHEATSKQIASVSGHKTLKEVERYTEAADQARLARAAMALLPTEQTEDESV